MRKAATIFAVIVLSAMLFAPFLSLKPLNAAPAPYFKLVASQGQGAGLDTFYTGRCFEVDIYLNTSIFDTNGADVEINYDNTKAQVVQSDCSTAATTIYSDSLFNAYPGAGNSVTASKIYLSAYNNPGVSTNTSYGLYGHFFLKVLATSAAYNLTFQYTPSSTIDTNLAETGGDGSDILQSVEDLTLVFADDSDSPDISGQSPVDEATGVAVNSTVSFNAYDAMAGVNSATIAVRMKQSSGTYYSQTASVGTVLSTNTTRYYQYPISFSPNANIKTNSGYYPYNTAFVVEATAADLASPAHSTTETWTFTTEDDTAAPYLSGLSPSNGATSVSRTTNISLYLKDYKSNGGVIPGLGVNTSSISVQVASASTGTNVYSCSSGAVTCNDADPNSVLVTVNPAVDFAENEAVTIQINAGDLHSPANSMTVQSASFTTADTVVPTLTVVSPSADSFGNAVSADVSFRLIDTGAGVDISSLQAYLNGTVYDATSPELSLSGDSSNYLITINPAVDFTDNTAIVVRVSARDNAPVPNYVSPNPTVYSFIVGLNDSVICRRIVTQDVICPACPAVESCEKCPEAAACPKQTTATCPAVKPLVIEAVSKCPTVPVCVNKQGAATSEHSGPAIAVVLPSGDVKKNASVAPEQATAATSAGASEQETGKQESTKSVDQLSSESAQEKAAPEISVVLTRVNGEKYKGETVKLKQADELVLNGRTNLPDGELLPLIFRQVGDEAAVVFYAIVDDGGDFALKIRNVFTDKVYDISTMVESADGSARETKLGSFIIAAKVESVRSALPDVSASRRLLIFILLFIVAAATILLALLRTPEAAVGLGIIICVSVIGLVYVQDIRTTARPKSSLSTEQAQFVAEQSAKSADYNNALEKLAQAAGGFEARLYDPIAKKALSGTIVAINGNQASVNGNGELSLPVGLSTDAVSVYFPDVMQEAFIDLGDWQPGDNFVNASLVKLMARLQTGLAQNKFRDVYAAWHKKAKEKTTENDFVHMKNEELLERMKKYAIISQRFNPRIEPAKEAVNIEGIKSGVVYKADYIYFGLNNDGQAVKIKEPWYFVWDNSSWQVVPGH